MPQLRWWVTLVPIRSIREESAMSSVKRIGLVAAAVTACVAGAFAATGFGEGGGDSSGFSWGRGATAFGLAEAAGKGGGGGKPKVILIFHAREIPPGRSFHEVGKCPKRSVAVNGQFGPDVFPPEPGVNMQGFAGTTRRNWAFQFENETGDPVDTILGVVCLKNVNLSIRAPG
jgi:hypothetical protein